MPDKRAHRGPNPDDARLFAPADQRSLNRAVEDLSWLLERGYASTSALKIVGDRHSLEQRQRVAVGRCACSDQARNRRDAARVEPATVADGRLLIDGYNVLTSIEAALAGGVILSARDGTFRDMASVHGTWRKVQETIPAVGLLGRFLADLRVSKVVWYLDRPVSNSGRLKTLLRQTAENECWPWEIELVPNPDPILCQSEELIATADSGILDRCPRWLNLARSVIERTVPGANVVDLSGNWK